MIDGTELKQVAYIYKCVNTTLQIKGKINSITVGEFLLSWARSVLEPKRAGTIPTLFLKIPKHNTFLSSYTVDLPFFS